MFNDLIDKYVQSDIARQFLHTFLSTILILLMLFILYKLSRVIYFKIKEKKYQKKLSQSSIKDIDRMDGLQFEMYLKALFKELGHKSQVTTGSHDFGADLIIKKNNKKIVIQAKRYKYKSNVSLDAVQQVYAAIPYWKADESWIITNSFYTKSAQKLAKVCNVKLLDRYKLVDFINQIHPEVTPKKISQAVAPKERKCPDCDGILIMRYSKTGNAFMGCSNFPDCKHTEPIAK